MKILIAIVTAGCLMAGCATTLQHPTTGQTVTCEQPVMVGGGTGIIGGALLGVSLVFDAVTWGMKAHCVSEAKRAGYEEVE
jgi:hypothetical protein